ncbi:MAG: peptidyl-prolyl cis-trans isomerase [Betaproteobacteria bacterium]|jgi:peptidyl-prolyl cis-trans isomerase C
MKQKYVASLFLMALLAVSATSVYAQKQKGPDAQILATVNGTKIMVKELEQALKGAEARGVKDSPEVRNAIASELIVGEAILQDVKKSGIEKKGDNPERIKLAQQQILKELWFQEYLKEHPVTEAEIKAEYDRQVALTKDGRNSNEYKLSQILVADETEANSIASQVNAGGDFAKLAKEKSLEKVSAAQGGSIANWVLPDQLVPPLGDTVVALTKGKSTAKPIKTASGWHIIRLDDIRKVKIPPFEEAKNTVGQQILSRRQQEAVAELMKKVTVKQGG